MLTINNSIKNIRSDPISSHFAAVPDRPWVFVDADPVKERGKQLRARGE
jgi:hypothetical protein